MDQFLRSRKFNSAAGRKKRPEQQPAEKRRSQHRRILYDEIFERPDMQISDSVSWPRGQRNGSAPIPREPAVTTLNAFATEDSIPKPKPLAVDPAVMASSSPRLRILVPEMPLDCHTPAVVGPPSPVPQMLPSLAAPSDWKYDRFSIVMAEFTLPTPASQPTFPPHFAPSPFGASLYDDSSVPELEDDNDDCDDSSCDSLLETAQPVSYHLPKVRPSVISIGSRGSSKEWKTLPSERELMSGSPMARSSTRSQRRESTTSIHSGFQACEAQLMEVPDLPAIALYMMSNVSADSVAMCQAKDSGAWSPDAMLNTIRKPGHGRMSSIKNIIKSPALSRVPSLKVQHRQSSLGRPSTAVADILDDNYNPFETVPADLNAPPARPPWNNREASTRSCTSSGPTNVFQAPVPTSSPPAAMAAAPDPGTEAQPGATRARRKSMKGLRKRGESIGQAFKMAALMARGGSKANESSVSPPPPVPALSLQQPPLPSSSTRFGASSCSLLPEPSMTRGPAGLGLSV